MKLICSDYLQVITSPSLPIKKKKKKKQETNAQFLFLINIYSCPTLPLYSWALIAS